jgi:sugar lactone lactonase YvrE
VLVNLNARCLSFTLLLALVPAVLPAQSLTISTLAGSTSGGGHVDGAASVARFSAPRGMAYDMAGNLYLADSGNQVIRKIASNGSVTTIAGQSGVAGSADGTGGAARFRFPAGIAVDPVSGTVYVADTENHTIRRITPAGVVTTIAGLAGTQGTADGTGSAARFTYPEGLAIDTTGVLYVADTSNHTIRKISTSNVVTTFAGAARVSGSTDGFGSQARFNFPWDVAVDFATGNLYVADTSNHTIRKVTSDGRVTTVAGLALTAGSTNGTGSAARFRNPWALDVDPSGAVFVADTQNNLIRRIDAAGVVTTVAGSGQYGRGDATGTSAQFAIPSGIAVANDGTIFVAEHELHDVRRISTTAAVTTFTGQKPVLGTTNGSGTQARFSYPYAVASDSLGNLYIVESAHDVRRIDVNGNVTTLAGLPLTLGTADGTGSAARFYAPAGIVADSAGNFFIADTSNHTIRKMTPGGTVTTFAGTAGAPGFANGTGSQARFNEPWGLAIDSHDTLYVADSSNHAIRTIEPAGVVTTFAGDGTAGSFEGVGTSARFRYPIAIALDPARNVYIADWGNHTIRKITPSGTVTTLAGAAGASGITDGTGSAARFNAPSGIATDADGVIYVADTDNSAIRRVTPAGQVTTIAGIPGTPGNADGTGSAARFFYPNGIAFDSRGRLIITDTYNHAVRAGTFAPPTINSFVAVPASIKPGAFSTLSWTTGGATSVEIDNGIGTVAVNGAVPVQPAATTTYTLTARGPGGTATTQLVVHVGGAKRRAAKP